MTGIKEWEENGINRVVAVSRKRERNPKWCKCEEGNEKMRVIIALWWRGRWKCRQEGWRQEAESVINKYASLCSVKCLSCHTFFSGTITDRGINKFIIRNYCLPSLSLKCEPITQTCCTTTTRRRSHKQQAKGFCCPRCTPLQSVCAALHLRLEWKSSDYHRCWFPWQPPWAELPHLSWLPARKWDCWCEYV